MALVVNCDCDCDYDSKTLAELRQRILDGLGFIDPLVLSAPRTLVELRETITDDLGFIGALNALPVTLADLRSNIKDRLGLAAATLTNQFQVSYLISELMAAIGAGAQASNPAPGMRAELLSHINEAQQEMFRRLELDNGGIAAPAILSGDSDHTTVDGTLVLTWAKGIAKAHKGQPDAKLYFDEAERILAALMQRKPPNIDDIIKAACKESQDTIVRRFELGRTGTQVETDPLEADDDTTTVDGHLVQLLALAKLKAKAKQEDAKECLDEFERAMTDTMRRSPPGLVAQINRALGSAHQTVYRRFEMGKSGTNTIGAFGTNDDQTPDVDDQAVYLLAIANLMVKYKVGDAKLAMATYEQYMQDQLKRSPPDRLTVVNRVLKMAQEILYQRYPVLRMERWYTWTLTAGTRFYGIDENTEAAGDGGCTKYVDPRKVSWVGVSRDDVDWRPLRCGIPPEVYTSPASGVPTHYEIRQCIEVWPVPVDGWKLRIKGMFGLAAFAADDDVTSMDWQAVELQALADAKAHYKQPDAQIVASRLNVYIGDLVAGTHQTRRYIPGGREPMNAVRPIMVQTES
jgi:hypothetical protein